MSDEPDFEGIEPDNPGGLYRDQPSPEDPDVPVNVYLTDVNQAAPANVLKGIREALQRLADEPLLKIPLSEAEAHLTAFNDGERPRLLGWAANPTAARTLAQAAVERANENIALGIGLTDADIEQIKAEHEDAPEDDEVEHGTDDPVVANRQDGPMAPLAPPGLAPDGEDTHEPPSLAACKMAVALMAQHEGNGTRALIWARILAETTGDPDWTGAARLILASLPLKDPSA